jgi:hypothetical protein
MRVDTLATTQTYFSDRAARPCGRFMAVVALPEVTEAVAQPRPAAVATVASMPDVARG